MRRPLTVVALLSLLISERALAQVDTAWRFVTSSDIERPRQCIAQELVVITKSSLLALDASTGAKLWERNDLPSLGSGLYLPCEGKTGLSYRQDKIAAFDLVSGQQRWDATALPTFSEVRGYATIGDDVVLLFLRTPNSEHSLVAVKLASGERLWQRDDLFQQPPTFDVRGGVSDIAGYQAFVMSGDTTLIAYLSLDGPIAIDLRTGATRWESQALAGLPVPALNDYAGMRLVDSTLVIPRDKGLVGIDARDGQVRWQKAELLPRRATRLARVSAGLLVRAGGEYVNVLDPVTGTSRWTKPLTLRTDGGAYAIVGNRYFLISRDRFFVADLATGDTTGFEKLRFKDNEAASGLIVQPDSGFVVMSRQNLFWVDARGGLRYQRYYNAPGTSFLQQMGGMYGSYGSAFVAGHYAYFVTNAPDSTGRKGNSLVRVALADGSETGRVWLQEKAPTYWPDGAREQVLMRADDRTLVAVRFASAPKP